MYIMIDCDLLASFDFMTDFNGIDRHYPYPFYPAGIYEEDKTKYKSGPASSEYPNLTLSENLTDKYGNILPAGFYMVVISDDLKYLNLYQSNELKARVKIIKLVEEMKTDEELNEEAELIGKIKTYELKKKLKKLRKAQEDYQAFLESEAAKNYASLKDSGKGYYILNYFCYGKKAEGVIQK